MSSTGNKEDINVVYIAINELKLHRRNNVIPFPKIYKKICPLLKMSKNEARLILYKLEKNGFLEIIPFHGVKILM